MKYATLQRAVNDAQRFIDLASQCKVMRSADGKLIWPEQPFVETGKDAAAAKRASMDLTRSLADMRANR